MSRLHCLVVGSLLLGCSGRGEFGSGRGAGHADGGPSSAEGGAPQRYPEQSGARLQVVEWFSGAAPVARKELRDLERDVPCLPTRAEDGAFRCLPVSTGGKVHFLDARCTVPVISVSPEPAPGCHEPPSAYVTYAATVSCPEPRTFAAVRGDPIETPPELYDSGGYDNCVPAVVRGEQFYSAIPSPPGDWASLTREVLPQTPGLGVELWRSEDGLRALGTLRILSEDAECTPGAGAWTRPPPYDTAAPARCTPTHPLDVGPFTTTPACGPGGEVIGSPRCAPEPFARRSPAGFLRVGARVEADVWLYLLGHCGNLGTELPDTVFHLPGEDLPASSFPELHPVRSPAGAVERLGWRASDGGVLLPDSEIDIRPWMLLPGRKRAAGWPDPAAGAMGLCLPTLFAEGTTLCVPPDTGFEAWGFATATTVYSDPTCAEGAVIEAFATERSDTSPVPEVGQWIVKNPPALPGPAPIFAACMTHAVEVRQVLGIHGPDAYALEGQGCTRIDPATWLVVDLGPPRPAREVLPVLTARAL